MTILHYIPSIDEASGGVGAYLQLLSYSLGKMVDLHIACHHSDNELRLENCTIHYIEGRLSRYFAIRKEYNRLLDELKPDIVHVNGCWMPQDAWTAIWAKQKGYHVVISPHGMLEPWDVRKNYWTKKLPALLLYQRKALRLADCLVSTAESERANLLKDGWNPKVEMVPNGIIVDGIEPRTSWEERKQIIYVGLLRENKGAGVLIEAVKLIRDRLDGWTVLIYGTCADDYDKILKKRIDELGVGNIVKLCGGIYGEEKWNAYRESDVFVLPTLNENFGIVIAESFLAGTPVITTTGAPWPEIKSRQMGWWTERTPEAISQSILEFISTPIDQRRQMGLRGRRFTIEHFASDIVAKQMVGVYQKVIS